MGHLKNLIDFQMALFFKIYQKMKLAIMEQGKIIIHKQI